MTTEIVEYHPWGLFEPHPRNMRRIYPRQAMKQMAQSIKANCERGGPGIIDWRHVYCLQRLAAYRAPANLLSRFVAWCLREIGKDHRVWWVATMADSGTLNAEGRPHPGVIYQATNAVYCGMSKGGRVEAFVLNGQRRSIRCGPKTWRLDEIPAEAKLIRSRPQHRYCWPVGSRLQRKFRRRKLIANIKAHLGCLPKYPKAYQPRLLARLLRRWSLAWKGAL